MRGADNLQRLVRSPTRSAVYVSQTPPLPLIVHASAMFAPREPAILPLNSCASGNMSWEKLHYCRQFFHEKRHDNVWDFSRMRFWMPFEVSRRLLLLRHAGLFVLRLDSSFYSGETNFIKAWGSKPHTKSPMWAHPQALQIFLMEKRVPCYSEFYCALEPPDTAIKSSNIWKQISMLLSMRLNFGYKCSNVIVFIKIEVGILYLASTQRDGRSYKRMQ